MQASSVRRALYVLYARLLASPPGAELYERLRREGLAHLAEVQGIDLFSDLEKPGDAEAASRELGEEFARLDREVSLHAADYGPGAEDPAAALTAYMREHKLRLDEQVALRPDHLAIALGLMGELSGQAESEATSEARERARAFFLRHVEPWAQRALAEVSTHARLRFYRGLASMISSFLASERCQFVTE